MRHGRLVITEGGAITWDSTRFRAELLIFASPMIISRVAYGGGPVTSASSGARGNAACRRPCVYAMNASQGEDAKRYVSRETMEVLTFAIVKQ